MNSHCSQRDLSLFCHRDQGLTAAKMFSVGCSKDTAFGMQIITSYFRFYADGPRKFNMPDFKEKIPENLSI